MRKKKKVEILPLFYDYVLSTDYPVYVLVGGRSSGKSFFMQQLAAINLNNKRDYKLMVVEDVETNIGEGAKEGIERRREELGLGSLYTSTKIPREIRHANGNSVIFRGYRTPAQQKQVKSINQVTAVWYEEAQNITYRQFKALRMQLRGGDGRDRQLFLTLNPINRDGFVSSYFFKVPPTEVFERFPDGRPKVFSRDILADVAGKKEKTRCMVIVSTHWDNPFLTPVQRADIEELRDTDEDMYKMLSLGMFVKGSGAFFPEFTPGLHTCRPFPVPPRWRRYVAFDYGLDMLACYWIALSGEGRRYVYREVFAPGLIISEAAGRIRENSKGENVYEYLAPPDLWNRRQESGKSRAEIFSECGVYLSKASNERQSGWLALKEWLRPKMCADGKKRPSLVIFDCCENLISSLSRINRDPANPCDVDPKGDHGLTHAPDALRYFAAGRPVPEPSVPKKPVYNFESEKPVPLPDMEPIDVV